MHDTTDPFAGKLSTPVTWVRWRIVALLVAFSFLSWFLRVSISVAYTERIKDQFHISEEAMGYVYSAFLLVYALCMTPGGWFIDRLGTRVALIVMGFGLTLFGALTGLVGTGTQWLASVPAWLGVELTTAGLAVVLFLVIRSVMGGFATPMYPAAAHAVAHWLPFRRRSGANGLVQGAACVGIASTPLLFGTLIDWFDWPLAFLIVAVVTGLVAQIWGAYAADRPEQHASVSPSERLLIQGDRSPHPEKTRPLGSWLALLRNRSLLCLTASYAAVGYFEYLFFFWMDYYFKDQLHLPDYVRRVYSAIPFLAMAAGMGLGGWLSDRLVPLYGYRRGRALVPILGMLAGGCFLLVGLLARQPEWIVTWFALALGSVGAVEAPTWTTAQELGGRRGGTAAGICNTGGNAGGILSPIVTPLVSATVLGWPAAIALGGLVCLAGAGLWLWIDPAERVAEPA